MTLKGKAEPVAAFRLIAVRGRNAERASVTTPFVGRKAEMDRLEMTLLEVGATRSCELLNVVGEAGVGKSRLIREFAIRASARERSQVLRGRCLPYGDGVTFWPIAEIVRSAAGINDEDPLDVALAKIAEIARGVAGRTDDPTAVADRVAAAIGLSTAQFPGPELFWGIRKLLEAIASRRPLVAIVDDIHVAAPTFLELLDHLLDTVHGAPILLLTSARHELFETRAEWAEGHEGEHIVLEPLSADEADSIVDQLLAGLDGSVRDRILTAAEGNPLYVEQIASMLIETGAVRLEGDRWVATTSSSEIAIPPTVEALVAARLDALGSEERRVIDPASVIGLGLRGRRARPPRPRGRHAGGPGAARDADLQAVHPPDRRRGRLLPVRALGHQGFGLSKPAQADPRRASRAVRRLGRPDQPRAWPRDRVRGDPRLPPRTGVSLSDGAGIGRRACGIGGRAAIKLSSAGRRAFARGDIPAAVNLLRRSIALLPATSAFRLELMVDLGDANLQQGDFDAAANVLDETIAIADEAGQERYAVRAAVLKAAVDQFRVGGEGGQSRAMEVATRSIAALERLEDAAGLARAWRLVMYAEGNQGHVDEASAAAARVIEYAGQAGDRRLASRSAPPIVAFLLHGPATVAAAVARCEELLDITQGDRKVEAVIVSTLAVLRAMEGRFDEARALYRRGQATLAELGTGIDAHSTSIDSARVERLAGDPRTAELELRRDYSALEAIGESYLRSTVAASLAEVLFLNGDLVGANAYSEITEQIADPDDVEPQVKWRMVRARVLAASDAAVSAVRLATEGVNLASATSDHLLRADALTDLGDVFLVVGDPESLQGLPCERPWNSTSEKATSCRPGGCANVSAGRRRLTRGGSSPPRTLSVAAADVAVVEGPDRHLKVVPGSFVGVRHGALVGMPALSVQAVEISSEWEPVLSVQ